MKNVTRPILMGLFDQDQPRLAKGVSFQMILRFFWFYVTKYKHQQRKPRLTQVNKKDLIMIQEENRSNHTVITNYDDDGATTSTCDVFLEKEKVEDNDDASTILLEDEWGQAMLRLTNAKREALDQHAVEWDDACARQAQVVAQQNAEQESFTLGDAGAIKTALQEAGHSHCCGTFRITAKTIDLTLDGSSVEALDTLEKYPELWNGLMTENAAIGGFAAAQQGNRVYWAGVLLRTFETMNSSGDNN